ncbi:hypothetical protein LCGC14_1179810 [marine sediment metagenome]|uniref:Uncharacterized protein n=1 Tax=marine sediment metagenome TaxID=412755 RepID=A0A0F9LMN6_9ZZZZ
MNVLNLSKLWLTIITSTGRVREKKVGPLPYYMAENRKRFASGLSMTYTAIMPTDYNTWRKTDLARLAAQTGQDTYTGFLRKYDKAQLVRFIEDEYEYNQ